MTAVPPAWSPVTKTWSPMTACRESRKEARFGRCAYALCCADARAFGTSRRSGWLAALAAGGLSQSPAKDSEESHVAFRLLQAPIQGEHSCEGPMRPTSLLSHRPIIRPAFALVLAVALLTTGCSSDGKPKASSTTSSSAATTTPAGSSAEAAVLDGYRGYWSAYLKAGDPMDPENSALREHTT